MIPETAERPWTTVWYEAAADFHSIAAWSTTTKTTTPAAAEPPAPLSVRNDRNDRDYDQKNLQRSRQPFSDCKNL